MTANSAFRSTGSISILTNNKRFLLIMVILIKSIKPPHKVHYPTGIGFNLWRGTLWNNKAQSKNSLPIYIYNKFHSRCKNKKKAYICISFVRLATLLVLAKQKRKYKYLHVIIKTILIALIFYRFDLIINKF